jgi:uncharacterized RDD family membrane protein YckC
MSLKYNCPHCNQEIIADYLNPGEPCLCGQCRKFSPVPSNATFVEHQPAPPQHADATTGSSPQQPQYNPPIPGQAHPQRFSASAGNRFQPAERGARLAAAIIDTVVLLPIYALIFFGALATEGENITFGFIALMAIMLGLGVAGVQIYLLCTAGQTIGKKLLGIKIIKQSTGKNGGFVTNVLLRAIVNGLITSIPFVGSIYALVDVLFIFAEDRRCIHDHLAGTVVVRVGQPDTADPGIPQHPHLQRQQ